MKFCIQVNVPPFIDSVAHTAYQFTRACLEAGHTIEALFFNQEGVEHGDAAVGQSELIKSWRLLSSTHHLKLLLCSASVHKKNIQIAPDDPVFCVAGLGQLVTGIESADRFIQF